MLYGIMLFSQMSFGPYSFGSRSVFERIQYYVQYYIVNSILHTSSTAVVHGTWYFNVFSKGLRVQIRTC